MTILGKLIHHAALAWQSPVSHWCLLAVVLAVTIENGNNVNPYSRFETLVAMAETHGFALGPDATKNTCDWARTPDDRVYSNKAPGAALLAFPLYWPVDTILSIGAKDRAERDARRLQVRESVLGFLSIILQAIPLALMVAFLGHYLAARGVNRPALEFMAIAILFGNTGAILANTFYAHALAAALAMALAWAFLEERYAWAGFLFGMGVLVDYGSAMLLPAALLLVALSSRSHPSRWQVRLSRFALGGLAPLIVFATYHWICFGGPFTLPNKFQNPVFVEGGTRKLWGIISFFPQPEFAQNLAFGKGRGLLYTQPWVLLGLVLMIGFLALQRRWPDARAAVARQLVPFALLGFAGIFAMIAAFGGWHGGVCPGPRYLAAAFPLLALALAVSYDSYPRLLRWILWVALLPALTICFAYWSQNMAIWPHHKIWTRIHEELLLRRAPRSTLRATWILSSFLVTAVAAMIRARRASRSNGFGQAKSTAVPSTP